MWASETNADWKRHRAESERNARLGDPVAQLPGPGIHRPGARGPRAHWIVSLCLCALAACAQEEVEVLPIERLAFVPRGQVQVGGQTLGARAPLLVDRFEITQQEWEAWTATLGGEVPAGPAPPKQAAIPVQSARSLGWHDQWPAVGMTIAQAEQFAVAKGMRLPTVREWLWIAGGTRAMTYPYGINPAESAANTLGLGLDKPTPVGTFPNGRTPGDPIYDLQGNAAEWAWSQDWHGTGWRPYGSSTANTSRSIAWSMGGSYMTHDRPIYRFEWDGVEVNAQVRDPQYRSSDLGARCVIEARTWLRENWQNYEREAWAPRLKRVGEQWGPRAIELLQELRDEFPQSILMEALLEGARKR